MLTRMAAARPPKRRYVCFHAFAMIKRTDVPNMLGKSYRRCVEDDDFGKIRTNLENRAIYDKVSTLLLAGKLNKRNKDKKNG